MTRPKLLDLFCGAGGCAMGYHRAGFDVVGVDSAPQPHYPFPFILGDALNSLLLMTHGCGRRRSWPDTEGWYKLSDFAAIHASPPCQRYTVGRTIHNSGDRHPDLIEPTRKALMDSGKPWVIENVMGAPMSRCVVLCGLMFGLRVLRHRAFECSHLLFAPPHPRHPKELSTGTNSAKRGGAGNGYSTGASGLVCVAGNNFVREAGAKAMGIDWHMTRKELANTIPPAYCEWIGKQLIAALESACEPADVPPGGSDGGQR